MNLTASPPPDGICPDDQKAATSHHASTVSLLLLGGIIALGLSGWLGGGPGTPRQIEGDSARLTLDVPTVVRSGDVFETRVHLVAKRSIERLVVAVEPGLWRNVTNNATLPTSGDESYERGLIRYAFGSVAAGADFRFQIDHQVNPGLYGVNRGRLYVLDGEQPLVEVPLALTVLP